MKETISNMGTVSIANNKQKGKFIIANQDFEQGEEIAKYTGKVVLSPSEHTLQLHGQYIKGNGPLRHLRHSCDPNCCFVEVKLIAKKGIMPKQELTIDYLATETVIIKPFKCECGSENCRGQIG